MKFIEVIFQAFVYWRNNQDCLFCTEKHQHNAKIFRILYVANLAMHEVDANMCK